jgi:hypothetical protein
VSFCGHWRLSELTRFVREQRADVVLEIALNYSEYLRRIIASPSDQDGVIVNDIGVVVSTLGSSVLLHI